MLLGPPVQVCPTFGHSIRWAGVAPTLAHISSTFFISNCHSNGILILHFNDWKLSLYEVEVEQIIVFFVGWVRLIFFFFL
jgi:hypothetical protein